MENWARREGAYMRDVGGYFASAPVSTTIRVPVSTTIRVPVSTTIRVPVSTTLVYMFRRNS
jgi:hypothetical protein